MGGGEVRNSSASGMGDAVSRRCGGGAEIVA